MAISAQTGFSNYLFRCTPVQILRVSADIDNAGSVLRYAALDSNHLHRPGADIGAVIFISGGDGDAALPVFNPHITGIVGDVAPYYHIRNGSIGCRILQLVYYLNSRADPPVIVQHTDPADAVGRIFALQGCEFYFPVLIRIQVFDIRFSFHTRVYAVLVKANLSAVFSHFQPIQYQVGVGQVIDLDPGRTVGFQFSLPIQRVGLYHNTAAADAEARDFHIADRVHF